MATSSLDLIASPLFIDAAWKDLLGRSRPKSRNTVGVDGICINDFLRDPKPRLRSIARELRAGNYAFSPLRPHLVLKPNGKDRLICVPTVNDRVVQRAILNFLNIKYGTWLANPISYGFVKGRNVEEAAKRACTLREKQGWAFKTDISAFFDRVDRHQLRQRIAKHIRHRSLHKILMAISACEIEAPSGTSKKRIAKLGIQKGLGVRQGMPLSPFFANLFLAPFDMAIQKAGLNAVRYADDLIFFADSHGKCVDIEKFCKTTLGRMNLHIPDLQDNSKTIIAAPNETTEFLGLGLTKVGHKYELVLLPKQRDAIRSDLLQLGSIPDLLSRKIQLADLGRAIDSRVAGYLHAYECCSNHSELENDLDNIRQKILQRIYGPDGLSINTSALSKEKRTFLGLT